MNRIVVGFMFVLGCSTSDPAAGAGALGGAKKRVPAKEQKHKVFPKVEIKPRSQKVRDASSVDQKVQKVAPAPQENKASPVLIQK